MKIAILGSNSHIAKGLIFNFLKNENYGLHLYTTSLDKICQFLGYIGKSSDKNCVIHQGYKNFAKSSYDVIINCVGLGTLNKLRGNYSDWFIITEEYDNLAIAYLRNNSAGTLYINFSSGAVYGREFLVPAEENAVNALRVNHIVAEDYYAIAKLNAEAKHRSFKNLKIVDLRIFSYFSRFSDLTDDYFITEIMNCILNKKTLVTDNVNIVRDYVHPEDLFSIILKCMEAGNINEAFDVTSAKPVEKSKILDYFCSVYGLKYKTVRSLGCVSATGSKNIYCSKYNNASRIGYKPAFSSMDTIKEESKYIINR